MLAIFPAVFLVFLELTVGSFLALWLLDLRGDTSRGFVIFQGALYLVFGLLTILAMNAFASVQALSGFGLDMGWLSRQAPLVITFTLLMLPWNVLLWRDKGSSPNAKRKRDEPATTGIPPLRMARFIAGGVASAVGLIAVFADGMAFRTMADSRLGGAFVVAAFLAGAIAIGAVMTAMLLGHWYLNTPTASGRPLEFVTTLTLGALALAFFCALLVGPSTAHVTGQVISPGTTIRNGPNGVTIIQPTPGPAGTPPATEVRQTPLDTTAFFVLEVIVGGIAPLALAAVALHLTRGRSFQSATGMLYLCVAFVFLGEIMARGLLLFPAM
ncbi:MAG TPA: hypothetical protein VF807_00655 [Ktedonobacterales bacterium]